MAIDPVLKMFWILIAAILGTNAAWFFYVGLIEDEIAIMYKAFKLQRLSPTEKKKLSRLERRARKWKD